MTPDLTADECAPRPEYGHDTATPRTGRRSTPHTHHFAKTDTAAQRVNAAVGLRITLLVGTMWCAYVFAVIALISLPDNVHSTQLLILWISSSFLQLVLLPSSSSARTSRSRAADARAAKTFEDVEDARRKIAQAIDLLDIHTDGGLHDAVAGSSRPSTARWNRAATPR